ncbi:MAG: 6-bladed beta-propeller [Runella sp.]
MEYCKSISNGRLGTFETHPCDLSQSFAVFEYIELKLKGNHFFKKIDKIQNIDNRFYLLGRTTSSTVLNRLSIFTKEGHELFSLSAEDTKEILKKESFIDDFALINDNLYVLLGKSQTILVFDPSYTLIRQQKIPFVASRFLKTNTGFVFYKTLNPNDFEKSKYFHHIIYTNNEFDFKVGYFPFDIKEGERVYFDMNEPMVKENSNIYYTTCFNDTVYQIEESSINPKISINFETGIIRPSTFKDIHEVSVLLFSSENFKPFGISGFNETDKFIFFQTGQNASTIIYLKDKKMVKNHYFKFIESDLGILPPPLGIYQNKLYGVIDEDKLSQIPEKFYKKINTDIYEKVVESNSIFLYIFSN